jgi:uncharacterized protein YlxW (UPF0749 family)
MGLFWDLIQQSQIEDQKQHAASLEDRVTHLENELDKTQALLVKTLKALETAIGKDIDGDGVTG